MDSTSTEMSLKLIIDPRSRIVLFAEAGKDIVDFIFSFLFMPLAFIVRLFTEEHMVGSIGSIYKSFRSMEGTHLECREAKSLILNPTFALPSKILTGSSSANTNGKFYKCAHWSRYENCSNYVSDTLDTLCPNCDRCMTTQMTYAGPNCERISTEASINTSGLVKGLVACTITDDLTVMPVSSVGTLALLNKLDIKDASLLEERTVKLGTKECLELLKASLKSKTVLTDVFLGMKADVFLGMKAEPK